MKRSLTGISLLTLSVCSSLYSENHYRLVPLTSVGITRPRGINDRQIVIGTDDTQNLVVAQPNYLYGDLGHLSAEGHLPLVSAEQRLQVEALALSNRYYAYTTTDRRTIASDFSQSYDLNVIGIGSFFHVASISDTGFLLVNINAARVAVLQPLFGWSTIPRSVAADELGEKVNANGTFLRMVSGSLRYADGTIETLPTHTTESGTRTATPQDLNDCDVALWSDDRMLYKRTSGEDLPVAAFSPLGGNCFLNNFGTTVVSTFASDFASVEVSLVRGNQVTSLSEELDFAANGIARVKSVAGINNLGQITLTLERTDHSSVAALLNPMHQQAQARIINASILAQGSSTSPVILGASTATDTTLLFRAAGPSLLNFGVTGASSDPSLSVHSESGSTSENQDWPSGESALLAATTTAGAFPFPENSKDSALVWNGHGNVTSVLGGAPGKSLMEIYDASGSGSGSLQNISARLHLDASGKATLGFVISAGRPVRVMLRAMGPSLDHFDGLKGIDKPLLRLRQGQTTIALAKPPQAYMTRDVSSTVGAFYFDSASADVALFNELPAGAYTAEVSNQTGTEGDVLLEIYVLPDATLSIPDFIL